MLTDEQLQQRLNYVTGSDAAIICGESKYCTPYRLWEYKTRRAVAEDISHKPAVKAGNMLEGAVRDWLGQELGKDITPSDMLWVHDSYHWMAGNIDGKIRGESAIVEIKTSSNDTGWGGSGSDIIPSAYRLQIAHYMAVTNASRCHVGVLIRGIDFRHYCIDRDMAIEQDLIEREKAFWDCVQADIPPEPLNDADRVKMLTTKEAQGSIVATFEIEKTIEQYNFFKEYLEATTQTIDELKESICVYMRDASTLVNEHGRIVATWNNVKGRSGVDTALLKKKFPEVYAQVCKVGNASRRFEVK